LKGKVMKFYKKKHGYVRVCVHFNHSQHFTILPCWAFFRDTVFYILKFTRISIEMYELYLSATYFFNPMLYFNYQILIDTETILFKRQLRPRNAFIPQNILFLVSWYNFKNVAFRPITWSTFGFCYYFGNKCTNRD
jgi:hypothetical protein